jgi:hypothetical protein
MASEHHTWGLVHTTKLPMNIREMAKSTTLDKFCMEERLLRLINLGLLGIAQPFCKDVRE